MAKLNFDSNNKKISKAVDFDFDPVMVILGSIGAGAIILLGILGYSIAQHYLHGEQELNYEKPPIYYEEVGYNPAVIIEDNNVTIVDLDTNQTVYNGEISVADNSR